MPSSERITGKTLTLTLGGIERACDVTGFGFSSEEADDDVVTYCDAAAGGKFDTILTVSAIASTASGSFWRYLFENPGEEDVAYVVAPHGNAVATANQPHLTGTLTLPGGMPELTGETNSTSTFDVEFKCDARPVLKTTA
ncbi:hypothetical protein ACFWGN_21455 [Oerskovia sp. NPDC060338]|uniref:hypothetical protein n=1 Tax=Oerskovia sp. NPDC060338 TaxID=3347100 RepID=UPI003649002B